MPRYVVAGLVALVAACSPVPAAAQQRSPEKGIAGPFLVDGGTPAFEWFHDLGVGTYEHKVRWDFVAQTKPKRPQNPRDRAYEWPDELAYVTQQAAARGIQVAVTVIGTPAWANGGRGFNVLPRRRADLADFLAALSRRHPSVKVWRIGEDVNTRALTQPFDAAAPSRWAEVTDAAYRALKRVDRRDLVVGGNTISFGDRPPLDWLKAFVTRSGNIPRLDLYGHAPLSLRRPQIGQLPRLGGGLVDFADLDLLIAEVDRSIGFDQSRRVDLYLSRYVLPGDSASARFEQPLTEEEQGNWVSEALAAARASNRIRTLVWETLQDEPVREDDSQFEGGLLRQDRTPKPAYLAYKFG